MLFEFQFPVHHFQSYLIIDAIVLITSMSYVAVGSVIISFRFSDQDVKPGNNRTKEGGQKYSSRLENSIDFDVFSRK